MRWLDGITDSMNMNWSNPGSWWWTGNPGLLQSMGSFSSVQSLSRVRLFATPWTAARQASPSITDSGLYPNSSPLSAWCYPTLSSSAVSFSSCPPSFLVSGSFPVIKLFTSGAQSIGALVSASVLPVNIHHWFLLGLTGLISLLSKGLSDVFSSITLWKHQFFGTQPSV